MTSAELIHLAKEARLRAYVPYSKFAVGAAVWTEFSGVFTGCNIENASYGLTNCAERTAVFQAISTVGFANRNMFKALAVVADSSKPISPCGACRQVLAELCPPSMPVYLANLKGDVQQTTVGQLLPFRFSAADLISTDGINREGEQ